MITLLTDFGEADGYVAAMKGVIAGEAPGHPVMDACHQVPRGDTAHAAWVLRTFWKFHPAGTLHVVVVDPGVGSLRRGMMVHADGQVFVGPDNGVFEWVFREASHWEAFVLGPSLRRPGQTSTTFHGRDIFSWVAARWTCDPERVRTDLHPCPDPVRLNMRECTVSGTRVEGQVIHIDSFGNAITNIPHSLLRGVKSVACHHPSLTWSTIHATYSDVPAGETLALTGSHGFLELAANGRDFAQDTGVHRGDLIHIEHCPQESP